MISLENVSKTFTLHTQGGAVIEVLSDVSLSVAPGECVALTGASGAGKSTVFNVLTRLAEADGGTVTLGGVPIAELDPEALRAQFSMVTQDAMLFDETVADNILLGRSDVSPEALHRALDAAQVTPFLPQLSNGLESIAGPRGSALSGGQRQRVAIARALLRDTPILLLDEVAAHLDAARRAALYDEICALGAQAWMTGTGPELFEDLGPRAQVFEVHDTDGASTVKDAGA